MRARFLLACVLAAGCGEAIVPGELIEEPVLSVHGTLVGLDGAPVRVGALWVDPLSERDDWPSPRDLTVSETDVGGAFELGFLRPPPARAIRAVPSPQDATTSFAFAFAEIVAFEDRDGDGSFQVKSLTSGSTIIDPDVYRGSAGSYVVIYIDRPRTDPSNVIGELDAVLPLPRGYYLTRVNCTVTTRGNVEAVRDTPPISMSLVSPTPAFPESRLCLRSHPSAATTPGANGTACTNAVACDTGYCVDGVCCNQACGSDVAADCQACSVAAGASANGTCTVLSAPACDG